MDQFGQNAFAPGMKSALFIPDQLVAGTLQLVTDTGIITGGAFKRGTVLGLVAASGKYTQCVKTAEDGSQVSDRVFIKTVGGHIINQLFVVSNVEPDSHGGSRLVLNVVKPR